MKRYNRFAAVLMALIALFPLSLLAQDEATALLERTAEAIRSSEGIKASFAIQAQGVETEGTIFLKGTKFKLETEGVKTWFDGTTQWTLVEETEEVNISEPTAEELQSINPYAWLSLYKEGYKVRFGSGANEGERSIVMTTTKSRLDMQSIVLTVNERTLAPVRLSMAGRGGKDVAVIFIQSYDDKQHYDDTLFTYPESQYPDVEVVDLR